MLNNILNTIGVSTVDELVSIEKDNSKINKSTQEKKQESVFQCSKCKNYDVTFREKQTRSTDEGASIYFNCNTCGNKWYQK